MPTTTTGVATEFIQFTRASNATVTDSDGKIKWAPHNLLLASESFDAASWVKSFLSVAANSTTAPNGTTTADKLYPTSSSGRLYQTVTVPEYSVLSFYAKAAEMTALNVRDPANNSIAIVYVDLNTGAVSGSAAANASAVPAEDDWWFITWATAGVAYANVSIAPCNAVGSTASTPSGTNGVYLWGASLYRSDLAMQPNTSAYPMYNPTTPKNLFALSENFNAAPWELANTTIQVNTTIAPNGLQTADRLVETTATGGHYVTQAVTTDNVKTFSVYAKAGERSVLNMYVGSAASGVAYFDLLAGTVAVTVGGVVSSGSITSVGNGWYRCSVTTGVMTSGTKYFVFGIGNPVSYTGDGTSGIYLWGAQLSDSASLDPYVPVYGAAVTSAAYYGPRRDFDPVTLACKGLLVEEQRVNLLTYSAQFDDAAWSKNGAATITADTTVSPDGASTADTLTGASGDPSVGTTDTVSRSPVVSSSTAYTASLYVKGITGTTIKLVLRDGSTGTVASVTGALTSSWQRISCTLTSGAATTGFSLRIGGTNGTVAIWGAQLEAGSFATSYIPTGAATATRNADVASVSTQAFPYSATEGTIVANFMPLLVSTANVIFNLGAGSDSNSLYSTSGPSQNLVVRSAGSTTVLLSAGGFTVGQASKLGAAFKSSDYAVVTNGGTVATVGSGALPTGSATTFALGGGAPLSGGANGHIRQITYLPRRLTNTELQTRTA